MPGFIARVGDIAGGVISAGMPTVTAGGIPVARVGDVVAPHGGGIHGAAVLASGSKTVLAGGIPVCRVGDTAACGHVVMNGLGTVIVGP